MRGKCERRRGRGERHSAEGQRVCGGSVNAGAEVQTRTGRVRKSSRAMSIRGSAFSTPWLQFHGGGSADVYIIIRVRASRCGECALNPPTSQHIPRRRSAPAPAQRHALPEHFRSPFPRTFAPPRSADARPPTSQHISRRRPSLAPFCSASGTKKNGTAQWMCDAFPADLTTHSPPKTFARPRTATRPSRALPPAHAAPTHTRRPHNTFPTEDLLPPPHSDTPFPHTSAPPRSADAHPQAARCIPRRPHNTFPTEDLRPPSQRRPASPSVPLRAQKNGTAQWMCDAECLGRPSLRSVIGVGEPRAVRRRCGALAWRVGLRPQPWALRSRRCGRVLRA